MATACGGGGGTPPAPPGPPLPVAAGWRGGAGRGVRQFPQAARAGVVAVADGVLVATDDSVFRLNAATGGIEARAALPGTSVTPAALQGDTVVVTTADGHV